MSGAAHAVLFDLSILGTETRVRGIGRYVAELGHGLFHAQRATVRMRFLESAEWLGSGVVNDDADAAIRRLTSRNRPLFRYEWAYRHRAGLARAARASRADLVHVGYANARPLGRLACPRVVTCHDLIPLRYPDRYVDFREGWQTGRRWLDERRYHEADHVIAISRATADDLVGLLGVPSHKISIVQNGIDLSRWSATAAENDGSALARLGVEARRYLFYAGDADWRKNADNMLAAVARARTHANLGDLRLVWAGKLAPERKAQVEQSAREHGIEHALVLLGFVKEADLHALYRGALATLFVSRAEGFGYPVLEAMALGSPVITSNCSSLPEVAGDAALLVDPEDPEAIAEAIRTLSDHAELRARLAAGGPERARVFTLERQARATLDVYESLLKR